MREVKKRLVLDSYFASIQDKDAKKRYLKKLNVTGGTDPYETKKVWKDDVDLWPSITHINLAMYLLVPSSPYSGNDRLNYKSLDCYRCYGGLGQGTVYRCCTVASNSDTVLCRRPEQVPCRICCVYSYHR